MLQNFPKCIPSRFEAFLLTPTLADVLHVLKSISCQVIGIADKNAIYYVNA